MKQKMNFNSVKNITIVSAILIALLIAPAQSAESGKYFAKKKYIPQPLPTFQNTKDKLPRPIFDQDPNYVKCYWKVWQLAFKSFKQPKPGSPFVSNYIDEAFNPNLFLWDTAFMTMFCNYANPYIPGIQSLDNFYCTQLEDGEIVREVDEADGQPSHFGTSQPGTPHSLNHPILAWAEIESYKITGDKKRLEMVYEPLVKYYYSYDKIKEPKSGLYLVSWASMDNSPRLGTTLCAIDTSSEVAMFARNLSFIANELGKKEDAKKFTKEADTLSAKINKLLWDSEKGFYFDWAKTGKINDVWTIAGYWPMLAKVADKQQAAKLVKNLLDPEKFARKHMVPTTPANQKGYNPKGDYWKGSVWAPTNTMVIRGLENYNYNDIAYKVAMNHLGNVVKYFEKTGTVWENYAPDSLDKGSLSKPDFVGWTGIGPIVYFIEYAIGIKPDAASNTITWDIKSNNRIGVENLWFNNKTLSLLCEKPDTKGQRSITAKSDGQFTLKIIYNKKQKTIKIPKNKTINFEI